MKRGRLEEYKKIEDKIGNTKVDVIEDLLFNDNNLFVKREADNGLGNSHYDRVYLHIIKYLEQSGEIKPGDSLLETSSGSAGASFSAIAAALGYHPIAIVPKGIPQARIEAIRKNLRENKDLILTPKEDYVHGFEKEIKKNWLRKMKEKEVHFLSHSQGPKNKKTKRFEENKKTIKSLEPIGEELIEYFNKINSTINYTIPIVGNGSNIRGIIPILKSSYDEMKAVGVETLQSGAGFEIKYPGLYEKIYGLPPGSLSRHNLPGTSFRTKDYSIDFPHLEKAAKEEQGLKT